LVSAAEVMLLEAVERKQEAAQGEGVQYGREPLSSVASPVSDFEEILERAVT
jgi:hypothetical protein